MVDAIPLFVGAILRLLRTRRRLLLENLALRQQIAVLKRKHTRPRLAALDKLFWVLVRRFWSEWKQALIRGPAHRRTDLICQQACAAIKPSAQKLSPF